MTTTSFTAWATTRMSAPSASPGICITSTIVNDEGYREDEGDWITESAVLPDIWGQSPYDRAHLDIITADSELRLLGYQRVGHWMDSGGQWAAEVKAL